MSFDIIDQNVSAIVSLTVNETIKGQLEVVYQSCEQPSVYERQDFHYMLIITEGLSTPVFKQPIRVFKDIPVSRLPTQLVVETGLDLMNNDYTVALSLGGDIPKMICAYSQLSKGKMGVSFTSRLAVEGIEYDDAGVQIQVRYQHLDGGSKLKRGDSIAVFDITGYPELLGCCTIDLTNNEGVKAINLRYFPDGALISLGYYFNGNCNACYISNCCIRFNF